MSPRPGYPTLLAALALAGCGLTDPLDSKIPPPAAQDAAQSARVDAGLPGPDAGDLLGGGAPEADLDGGQ